MVKSNDIFTEINKLLVKAYPSTAVYINLCPKKFVRPSFLIESVKMSKSDVNFSTVQFIRDYKITCFTQTDEYHNTDAEALMIVQDIVIGLFNDGYITVGDRKIKCKSSSGGMEAGAAFVDVQFEYYDDRSEAVDNTSLMGTITTKIQEGQHGTTKY